MLPHSRGCNKSELYPQPTSLFYLHNVHGLYHLSSPVTLSTIIVQNALRNPTVIYGTASSHCHVVAQCGGLNSILNMCWTIWNSGSPLPSPNLFHSFLSYSNKGPNSPLKCPPNSSPCSNLSFQQRNFHKLDKIMSFLCSKNSKVFFSKLGQNLNSLSWPTSSK